MGKFWGPKISAQQQECVCHAHAKSLCDAVSGRHLRVECLRGEDGVCERLREMGFCETSVIEKLAGSGTLICKVCDARVVLSKELAQNVMVKDICSCERRKHA